MKIVTIILIALCLTSCDYGSFDADKRQIMAKDAIHYKLGRVREYDVHSFRQDTLPTWTDTMVKKPIRYSMDVSYVDSTGTKQSANGWVVFAPDGKSILETHVDGR